VRAGDEYLVYADGGGAKDLFSFKGLHAYADKQLWSALDAELCALKSDGRDEVNILDAGGGPGTWLRRVVTRARQLGFSRITARGLDVAEVQVNTARRLAVDLSDMPGVGIAFDVADITRGLPEQDHTIDMTLCLYSVLNHLHGTKLPAIAAELARITRGRLITTVRSAGSTPTIFVGSVDKARQFKLDHAHDRYDIDLIDGRHMSVGFHLFTAAELNRLFARHFNIEAICGLDIFHTRFIPDSRWNPSGIENDPQLGSVLAQLETRCATDPAFIDRATHLLLVGSRRQTSNDVVRLERPKSMKKICDVASV